ncbi:MAG: orotidine-5'-phosphate decarboxylase [Candidatus Sumerlaeia bacterium]|nr:orotidine-5'-phosphate decarboxylase [Candidatus Sumerlaeia bacterium]
MTYALQKLIEAQQNTGSLLSIGLEPAPEYLFPGLEPTLANYRRFLLEIITATSSHACAYKFNLAFFESLRGGWDLLFEVREAIPGHALVIADAKRGDIGSTAKHYARSLYHELNADSATVNPLMGSDSVEPFLEYADRLTFVLCLTSNPGAVDFLMPNHLYRSIAAKCTEWNTQGQVGMVVGATRPVYLGEIRELAPSLPFLIPGVGAQGGDLAETLRLAAQSPRLPNIIHVTRGILPKADFTGDAAAYVQQKTIELNQQIQSHLPRS